ncbi:MAG: electron transfer flavoprotein subunit beta/FixA family protein [Deltaproteobacteria bacterium]|nr:electron transfer flavoprotein subunit beta/FixA family protein [Deltaproteobacteria bacterium]
MKIAVLVKQVPDTETKIVINANKNGIDESNIKYIVSPYDEYAIEEAIKIGGETTVISMGPDRCIESIRTALAMGIQKAIHIDTQGKSYDSYQTAAALAKVIKDGGFDLVLTGKQGIDYDNGQVTQMAAELSGASQVMVIDKLTINGDKAKVERRIAGGSKEVYESGFPLFLGCEKGLNTPRYASLPGIMKAKSKPIEKKSADELLGGATALVEFTNFELPPERAAGKRIEGEPPQQAAQLVKLLREEAKVI